MPYVTSTTASWLLEIMGSNIVAETLLVPFCTQMKQYDERDKSAVSLLTQTSKLELQ